MKRLVMIILMFVPTLSTAEVDGTGTQLMGMSNHIKRVDTPVHPSIMHGGRRAMNDVRPSITHYGHPDTKVGG